MLRDDISARRQDYGEYPSSKTDYIDQMYNLGATKQSSSSAGFHA